MKRKIITAVTMGMLSMSLQAELPEIDSSKWKTDPTKYGMTAKEFIHAESRAFISNFSEKSGMNKWFHFQALSNKDDTWVVSPNNDTIYSLAAVNVTDGFSLTLPDVGDRFLSIHIIDENHMSPFYLYGGGAYKFTPDQFESDYVVVGIRMGTDGTDKDVKHIVEDLQPQYKIQGANPEDKLIRPDLKKMLKVRKAMIVEYDKLSDTFGVMTTHTSKVTDWEKFAYVSAGAWGLSEDKTAMYAPYAMKDIKGGECYTATYPAVPVHEFFSITVYGQDKFLMADHDNIVSSSQKAIINDDGSFSIVYGGMDCKVEGQNFLYTPKNNWSLLLRAYKPDVEKFKAYKLPGLKKIK